MPAKPLRVAYLVNRYPAASHVFIRREINALERLGVPVLRIALRGWGEQPVDADDRAEQMQTRYLLRGGALALTAATLHTALADPLRFLAALRLCLRAASGADRPLAYHLAYLAEACRARRWMKIFGAMHLHAHFGTNSAEVAMLV